jgi:cyclic pyranopterin phosphate synthase
VARAAAGLGFRKLRLTGGEPTLRPDIVEIVGRISAVDGIADVAMTTNAILLPRLARPLAEAGLRRINIHVDTFNPERLKKLMRFGTLDEIEAGIAAAEAAWSPATTTTWTWPTSRGGLGSGAGTRGSSS